MARFSFKEVAPCLFAILVDVLGFGLVAPLLIALFVSPETNVFAIHSSSLKYAALGVTLAIYPLFMFFGTSFIGDLSDIWGRKKTLALSMIGMAVGFLLMAVGVVIASFALFIFGRILSGLVAASQSVALAVISDLSTPENKAVHLSYIAMVQCVGFVLGPLIGGVLSESSLSIPFFGASFLGIIAFVWIVCGFKESFTKAAQKQFSFARIIRVFIEAYQNKSILHLCLALLHK